MNNTMVNSKNPLQDDNIITNDRPVETEVGGKADRFKPKEMEAISEMFN